MGLETATGTGLASAIERTVTGPMWHGPALSELLRDVTHEQAAARPIDGAHTVWELVSHVTAWAEISRQRLAGAARLDVRPEEDWPPMPASAAGTWKHALERLEDAHRTLAHEVTGLDEAALDGKVAGHDYSVRTMLHGVIEHGTYHGGQIALLKKVAR